MRIAFRALLSRYKARAPHRLATLWKILTVAAGLAAVDPAFAQATLTFDFNAAPAVTSNPTFNGPFGFVLSHASVSGFKGQAQWQAGQAPATGFMSLNAVSVISLTSSNTYSTPSYPYRARANFSAPVTSFSLKVTLTGRSPAKIVAFTATGQTYVLVSPTSGTTVTIPASNAPYVAFELWAAAECKLTWDDLVVTIPSGYSPDATHVRDVPVPTGSDVPILELDLFKSVASNVLVAGQTDADFCIAPDIRQTVVQGREVYSPRFLMLSELRGLGTCTGQLVPNEPETWESLLSQINLKIAPWFRAYKGKIALNQVPTEGYWLVISIVRSTAVFEGPVAIKHVPEDLINYAGYTAPQCNIARPWRALALGAPVAAFGEFENVEDNRMIMEAAQCNTPGSLSRRSTHVAPIRLDGFVADEQTNLLLQLAGIQGTIAEASKCVDSSSRPGLKAIQDSLATGSVAFLLKQYDRAVSEFEQIARVAKFSSNHFSGCPADRNYIGNFMSRGIPAAFTVFDRFQHVLPGSTWTKYLIPADLDVPLLTPDGID